MLNRKTIFALAALSTLAATALAPTSASAMRAFGGGFGGGFARGGGFSHVGPTAGFTRTTSFARTASLGRTFRGPIGGLHNVGTPKRWPIMGLRVNPTSTTSSSGTECWHRTNCGGTTPGTPPVVVGCGSDCGGTVPNPCMKGSNCVSGLVPIPCLGPKCGNPNPPPCVKLWGCGPHPLPPIVWWHKHHFHWGVVDVPGEVDTVDTANTVQPVVGPSAAPCNCLTKQYLNDGSVLFTDICTKEQAMATPDELQAQAQGVPPQAQSQVPSQTQTP